MQLCAALRSARQVIDFASAASRTPARSDSTQIFLHTLPVANTQAVSLTLNTYLIAMALIKKKHNSILLPKLTVLGGPSSSISKYPSIRKSVQKLKRKVKKQVQREFKGRGEIEGLK